MKRSAIHSDFFICKFHTVSSTQEVMRKLLKDGVKVPEFAVISSDFQSRGKGRLSRTWHSESGQNALFSFVIYPGIDAPQAYVLYQTAAVAVAEVLHEKTGLEALIKYPNDILVKGKKIAGILIDTQLKGQKIRNAVVGIGLNVNQTGFPALLGATSVKLETGNSYVPEELIVTVVKKFQDLYLRFDENEIMSRYLYLWHRKGLKKGIVIDNLTVRGKIIGIANDTLSIRVAGSRRNYPVRKVKPLL